MEVFLLCILSLGSYCNECNGCTKLLKFEFNDYNHCLRKTILSENGRLVNSSFSYLVD